MLFRTRRSTYFDGLVLGKVRSGSNGLNPIHIPNIFQFDGRLTKDRAWLVKRTSLYVSRFLQLPLKHSDYWKKTRSH